MARMAPLAAARSAVSSAKAAGEQFVLSKHAVEDILKRFLTGEVSKEELADWAEFFDANEDVEFVPERVVDVLFEMTSPEVNEWMNEGRAIELLKRLESMQ